MSDSPNMSECEGLQQELYDLYVLDLLETPESQIVRTHLERSCPACQQRMREGLNLWSGIALSAAEMADIRPRPALRRRILRSIAPDRPSWIEWFLMRETWAAAAVAVVCLGATVWVYGLSGSAGPAIPTQTAQVQPQPSPAVVNPPAVGTPAPAPAEANPSPTLNRSGDAAQTGQLRAEISRLERDLSASAASASQSETTLRSERERIQNLEAELGRQKSTLDAALQQRQQLEAEYRRVQAQAADRPQPDRTVLQRVQLLEEENNRLRRDINVLRQRADQGMQLASFLGAPGTRVIQLKGTEAAGRASAQILVSSSGRIMVFTNDLPALPAGREYQLWLVRSSGPAIVSAGVFRGTDRQAEFQVANASMLNAVTTMAVTEEPAGGSPKPTGHKVLIGTTKS
jgi:hypothetical protein